MARMNSEDRRERIIVAAQAVAARHGLSATTARDVAKEMGTSSGLIHHYFESMDELLALAFDRVAGADIAAAAERMGRADSPTGRIAAYLAAYADPANDPSFQFWLDAWAAAARHPMISERSRALNIEWQRLLAEPILDGIAAGDFKTVDVEEISWKALSLLDGLSLQIVAHPTLIDRETAATWAARSLENDLGLSVGSLVAFPLSQSTPRV